MKDKIKVLYIDDEDNNLNSFKAGLRKDFSIITALNAHDGLEIVKREEIHVVIADQRMPDITGVEFFEKMVAINPDPVRILLTGYSDITSVIDAINKGEVYRFIDKPWNIEQIKNAIQNAGEVFATRRELKEKNLRLKKIQAEMNQFVYALSHELRGPLMSISGISKLAKMENMDPNINEYFDMIDSATIRLDEFIYKMLDFHRSTTIDNQAEAIDFADMMSQLLMEKKGYAEIIWDINIAQNEIFFTDPAKLRVILSNLISNAVKFQKEENKEKKIFISISVEEDKAELILEDNGIGIDSRFQTEVFNLFQKATQKNVGSGLGLYMVKESVEQLGGKIELNSQLGHGTKLTVVLPSIKQDFNS
jgi:two-component system, sensor histidine kinase and response regulator